MKAFGIFLIVLGFLCFFMPFVLPAPEKKVVKNEYSSVAQTEAHSIFPLMGVSSIATGAALVMASFITNERGRKA